MLIETASSYLPPSRAILFILFGFQGAVLFNCTAATSTESTKSSSSKYQGAKGFKSRHRKHKCQKGPQLFVDSNEIYTRLQPGPSRSIDDVQVYFNSAHALETPPFTPNRQTQHDLPLS